MYPTSPIVFKLPNTTVAELRLNYVPYHWPETGEYKFGGGFSVYEPSEKKRKTKQNLENLNRYSKFLGLLHPHQGKWIEADCIAALIPDAEGQAFSVNINGVEVLHEVIESTSFRRRILRQKLPIKVTTCAARIFGGGLLGSGDKRGYGVSLDMKPFRW